MAHIPWQKSSFSASTTGNECVEVAPAHGAVLLRESDEPSLVIETTHGSLAALIRAVKVQVV
ncbi:DUF397 domain-containing protein [Streptomyces sp. HU2014]|uniref:DUF397 domain-containing protein n=1 Tax=Streptomyces sp. HU2014 TaxID=2939414 RepID=UPI00200E3B53|nr:DUF397 domain-containing protein [Streptomyces sp. HU2014]UQI49102.1 DUF397 domain-containing protein [Streptomyces sp. HU2014]